VSEEQKGAKKLQLGKRREPDQQIDRHQVGEQRHLVGHQTSHPNDDQNSHPKDDQTKVGPQTNFPSVEEKCVEENLTKGIEDSIQNALLQNKLEILNDKLDKLENMEVDDLDMQLNGESKSIVIDMDSDELESESSETDLDCDELEKQDDKLSNAKASEIKPSVKASEKRIIPPIAKEKRTVPKAKKIARENVPLTEPETGTINNPVVESEDEDEPSTTSIERTLELFDKQEKEDEARQKATAARKRKVATRKNNLKNKESETGATKSKTLPQQENKTIEMPSSSNQIPKMVQQNDDNSETLQSLLDDIAAATRESEIDFTEQLRLQRLRETQEFILSENLEDDEEMRIRDIELEYALLDAFHDKPTKRTAEGENPEATKKKTRATRKVHRGEQSVRRHYAVRF